MEYGRCLLTPSSTVRPILTGTEGKGAFIMAQASVKHRCMSV